MEAPGAGLELARIHNDGRIDYFWPNIKTVVSFWWPGCPDPVINTAKLLSGLEPKPRQEDVIVWSDGSWCYRHELVEMTHKSDDYETLPEGSDQWAAFIAKQ